MLLLRLHPVLGLLEAVVEDSLYPSIWTFTHMVGTAKEWKASPQCLR